MFSVDCLFQKCFYYFIITKLVISLSSLFYHPTHRISNHFKRILRDQSYAWWQKGTTESHNRIQQQQKWQQRRQKNTTKIKMKNLQGWFLVENCHQRQRDVIFFLFFCLWWRRENMSFSSKCWESLCVLWKRNWIFFRIFDKYLCMSPVRNSKWQHFKPYALLYSKRKK